MDKFFYWPQGYFQCSGVRKCSKKDCISGRVRLGRSKTGFCKVAGEHVTDVSISLKTAIQSQG